MKRLLALILVFVMVFTLASCEVFGGVISSTTTTTTTTTKRPTTTTTTTTTTTNKKDDQIPETNHTYVNFTNEELSILEEMCGVSDFPFIPNDDYYFEIYSLDHDDGTSESGVNFYAYGNTKAEFEAYLDKLTAYTLALTDVDEYGDTWYFYDSDDGTHYVDISYYETSDGYVVDVYIYRLKEDDDIGGDSTEVKHTYTDFTTDEKALFDRVVGARIPFIPNDDYTLEEYSYDYGDEVETGLNFYAFGNTQAEFDAYRAKFTNYVYSGSEADEYGDTWYYYDAKDGSHFVDMSFYYYEGSYVLDVYVYYLSESSGGDVGGGESGGGSTDTDENVITNEGAGLPSGNDGIFKIDFKKAEHVKDVTDQGYYIDGCPTVGSPAVLVIPVQFSDVTAASKGYTTDAIVNAFSKGGDVDYFSVYDYYYISSYGQLTLDITVIDDWFCPQYDSSYYYNATYDYYGDEVAIGDQLVLNEALAYLEGKMDLSKFDSDGNNIIDSVVLVNTLDIGEEDFYWAYRYWNIYTDDEGYYYEYDGVSANDYLWASYEFLYESYDEEGNVNYDDTSVMNTYTFIHEFGHILGLDDYYDTAYVGAPLDGCDMMDSMLGDHNAFSKFNLGWLTTSRLVTTDTNVTLTLEDFSKNGDTIIIANNWNESLGAYQEYYILVYYTNNGLNAGDYGYFSRDGIVVYHVNASLYKEEYDGEIYYDIYNNNTDASEENGYGTENNLIEFVKSGEDTFTYVVGSTFVDVADDNGNELGYTFTIDSMTSEYATITFTAK